MHRSLFLSLLWIASCAEASKPSIEQTRQEYQAWVRSLHQREIQALTNLTPHHVPGFVTDQPRSIQIAKAQGDLSKAIQAEKDKHPLGNMLQEAAEQRPHITLDNKDALFTAAPELTSSSEPWLQNAGLFCATGSCGDNQRGKDPQKTRDKDWVNGLATLQILKAVQMSIRASTDSNQPIEVGKGTLHCIDRVLIKQSEATPTLTNHHEEYTLFGMSAQRLRSIRSRQESGCCHFIGDFYVRRWLRLPLHRRYQYCCFESKLMRLLQEQGRPWIGLTWGTPEQPQCRGFTLEELQRIPLEQLDFTTALDDLWAHHHSDGKGTPHQQTMGQITQRLQQLQTDFTASRNTSQGVRQESTDAL